jgi:Fe-S cluster biogenesis protein NfuA
MFIQTQETPNPNALKFIPGFAISSDPKYFVDPKEAQDSFLVRKILAIQGIESVFLGDHFITVNKTAQGLWEILKAEVLMMLMDHFTSGLSVFDVDSQQSQQSKIERVYDSEIEKQIIEIIETRVRPSVAMDGGDIVYIGFKDGIVSLELRGACSGCPSSGITLKNGIEQMLKHYVPEVEAVEAINN